MELCWAPTNEIAIPQRIEGQCVRVCKLPDMEQAGRTEGAERRASSCGGWDPARRLLFLERTLPSALASELLPGDMV